MSVLWPLFSTSVRCLRGWNPNTEDVQPIGLNNER
jgi:hypothetical protein